MAEGEGGDLPFRSLADGVQLHVRLTPKAAASAVAGVGHNDRGQAHLIARVRALPEKGKANKELIKLLSGLLGVAPGTIEIGRGRSAREKTLLIRGDPTEIETKIKILLEGQA